MAEVDNLQVLRTIDKAARMPPADVFRLLTGGRKDESGDFAKGCGLGNSEAVFLTGFVFSRREPQILARLRLMEALESHEIAEGRTAWDYILELYSAMPEPKNIAWVLDDIIDATRAD